MTEETKSKTPRPPKVNKEQGSQKKKKRWKKRHHKKPVDMAKKLEQLQAHINGEYHSP
jgi:hypothetical protein